MPLVIWWIRQKLNEFRLRAFFVSAHFFGDVNKVNFFVSKRAQNDLILNEFRTCAGNSASPQEFIAFKADQKHF